MDFEERKKMTAILLVLSVGFTIYFLSIGMIGAALGAGLVALMILIFFGVQ